MTHTLTAGISSDDFFALDLVFKSTYSSIDLIHQTHLDLDRTTSPRIKQAAGTFCNFLPRRSCRRAAYRRPCIAVVSDLTCSGPDVVFSGERLRCTIKHACLPICYMPSSGLHGARDTSVRAGQQEKVSAIVAQMVSAMPGLSAQLCNP